MKTIEALRRLDKETKAEVFVVGGFVRDLLRNRHNIDLDIVVRCLSLKSIKAFLRQFGEVKEVNLAKTNDLFEINILLFKAFNDSIEAQITLPRKGKKQIQDSDNTLQQDVRFRDFKINAMYLPINFSSKKEVIDFVGGKKDIEDRRLTSNGSSNERIKESPIRMLRAISLSSRIDYRISEDLIVAIQNNASLISRCPVEAIRTEFNKILMSKRPSKYLRFLKRVGLLEYISPELNACSNIKQDNKYHKYDVLDHLFYTVDHCDSNLIIRLAGLLHDIGKPDTRRITKENDETRVTFHKHEMVSVNLAREFLKRLRYDAETTKQVLMLVKFHMFHFTREWTDAAIRKFIKRVEMGKEYMTEEKIGLFPLFRLRAAERLGNGLKGIAITDRQRDFEQKIIEVYRESNGLEIKDLKINGGKIMEIFNLRPGIQIGNILRFLLEKVLQNPKLNNELDLLKLTTEYLHLGIFIDFDKEEEDCRKFE
jgi:putative nucleotidyltransferase with HDIG domain